MSHPSRFTPVKETLYPLIGGRVVPRVGLDIFKKRKGFRSRHDLDCGLSNPQPNLSTVKLSPLAKQILKINYTNTIQVEGSRIILTK
jgi:hypothetical protein